MIFKGELKDFQMPNPVMFTQVLDLTSFTGIPVPDDSTLAKIFPGDGHSLKTWGRTPDVLEMDAHWIGVRKGTPLHVDPKYPRYTHQIMLRADDCFLRGFDGVQTPLARGLFFIVDTHSPHQLSFNKRPKDAAQWYVAVSLDSEEPVQPGVAVPALLKYAASHSLLAAELSK